MNITVRDCLKLPAFSPAAVVAGKEGLDRIVSSITVLEYADVSVISEDLFINHEICITAFTSIKDDPPAQCAVLKRLHDMGIAAVVLYYIGIFVPALDDSLVSTADELNLPLISMPPNRFDFRYGEMINDVMSAIFQNRMEDTLFVSEMLECISQLQEHRRTVSNVLRMLSDRLRCSFLLIDYNFALKGEAMWPMASHWSYLPLLGYLRSSPSALGEMHRFHTSMDEKEVSVSCAPVVCEKVPTMHLLAIDEMGALTDFQMNESAELIGLFLNIWDYNFGETSPDMLVKAILNNEPFLVQELLRRHNINMRQLQSLWILKEYDMDSNTLKQTLGRQMAISRKFMQDHEKRVLISSYQNTVVMLFNSPAFAELDIGLAETLLEEIREKENVPILIEFSGMTASKDIRDAYELMEKCFSAMKTIFPIRKIFNIFDLHFVENCLRILTSDESTLSDRIYPLSVLRPLNNYDDLVQTLSVYLLDADHSMKQTSALMFVHQNTVKYRINRIRKCFDCDISKMPEASALYYAVALSRLMER